MRPRPERKRRYPSEKDAIALEGFLAVMKREPERVLELFGEKLRPRISSEILLVSAYGLLGEKRERLNTVRRFCMKVQWR